MTTMTTPQGMHTMQDGSTARADAAPTGDLPVLDMVSPMLGFPEHREFALVRLDDEGTICELRSITDPDLRFVVVPPALFFPDYAPEITDTTAAQLRAESAEDLIALVVVTLGEGLADATANLLAPVLVNPDQRIGAQVLLDDVSLSLRAPLVPDHAPES